MGQIGFSPLAGIRYAETAVESSSGIIESGVVSVPLRGLDMRKPLIWVEGDLSTVGFQSPCGD